MFRQRATKFSSLEACTKCCTPLERVIFDSILRAFRLSLSQRICIVNSSRDPAISWPISATPPAELGREFRDGGVEGPTSGFVIGRRKQVTSPNLCDGNSDGQS